MARPREKTISYRRAVWFAADGKDRNFEQLIRDAHAKLITVAARKFKRAGGQFVKGIWHRSEKGGGYFMHIAAETPGDQASTLPQAAEATSGHGVDTTPPPKGAEYMDGDIIVFVRDNDLCICATSLSAGAIMTYCDELFRKAKLGDDATMFDLQKVANVDKLKMIEEQGVKEIDLTATLDDASVKYVKRKTATQGGLGVLGKHLNAVLRKDKPAAGDNIRVGIVLKTDGRMKKGKVLGAKRLKAAAKELVEGDDSYVIVTGTDQRISPDEIFVRERVEIERHGKSVRRDKACEALRNFHEKLVKTGVAAQ